jgi:hypothetical protein
VGGTPQKEEDDMAKKKGAKKMSAKRRPVKDLSASKARSVKGGKAGTIAAIKF